MRIEFCSIFLIYVVIIIIMKLHHHSNQLTSLLRRSFSHFQKGKLTLSKLRDKATIDEQIDHISLVFPDQYGRLAGLKFNAEYFLEHLDSSDSPFFEFGGNPFKFDISGTPIEFSEGLTLPDTLLLKPDMGTVREVPWQKKEAMIFADPYCAETKEPIPYAPRNALRACSL